MSRMHTTVIEKEETKILPGWTRECESEGKEYKITMYQEQGPGSNCKPDETEVDKWWEKTGDFEGSTQCANLRLMGCPHCTVC